MGDLSALGHLVCDFLWVGLLIFVVIDFWIGFKYGFRNFVR